MTFDEAVTLLNYRLGNRTDLATRIALEMQHVQTFLLEGTASFLPWFLETEIATSTAAEGEERVMLPEDFLAESEDQALWLYDENSSDEIWVELKKNDYDLLRVKYQAAGRPAQYALVGDYFLIAPTPDTDYTIKMRYYAKDAALATGEENKWLKHAADLLIAETGRIMSGHMMNPVLEAKFEKEATIARERLFRKHEARRHANRTYSMGED